MSKEVTIKITETGWKLKAEVNGNVYEEEAIMKEPGDALHVKGDLEEILWMNEKLHETLGSHFCFRVANALIQSQ
ncbi:MULTISPECIES: hypothetical protein [Bacillus]|jgi:hypothetical protein|uniref:Uncharacterized protein n=1 Tax=Bacillus paranthracis TaxID=2026186 RepID=A0AAX3QMJ3_9BACI|nr:MULTISPECIES: hypothetical protein [Bacillus]MEC0899875.1 hypothetical protein [Bacillus anthracis]WES09648.1 hypothetical protein P3K65_27430 [Bacillus paranthracis]HDR4727460.1 hypothetical protein [Bacillus cereus]HDX9563667.1 hypothetical protein [Bacillus thuringiensis]HDX9564504.1 hypothetical protein [Bacillus thuringiensis]